MKKDELKPILSDFLKKMVNAWFPDKPLVKGLGISLIEANINKYDSLIDMFADENGDIDIENLKKNIGETIAEPFKIDLTTISPILPNRILLISKEDIDDLFMMLFQRIQHQI